jgi:flagellar motor switch protein FliM
MEDNISPDKEQSAPAPDTESLPPQPESGQPALSASAATEKSNAQSTVFRKHSSFSATELRKLKARHEEFIRALASRLSAHLRLEVGLKISQLETALFGKWMGDLSNPTHLTLLNLEPFKGACLLDFPPQLALSIVDRELGGAGRSSEKDRALTEIEARILSRIVDLVIGEWCASWSDIQQLRPVLNGTESNGAFVRCHAADTMMFVVGLEIQLGEFAGQIQLAVPCSIVEPLTKKLNTEADVEKKPTAKTSGPAPKWNSVFDDVAIKVTAEIPSLKITTKAVAKLKTGDVISLEPEVFQHLRISLGQMPKFTASAGRSGPHWAAKITKVIEG